MTNKTTKKGFTLIELLVVVAIIGMISGIVMQNIQSARKKTMNSVRNQNIDQLANAVNLYLTNNNNVYPSTGADVWNCIGAGATTDCWSTIDGSVALDTMLGTTIKALPRDPAPGTRYSNYYVYSSIAGPYSTQASYTTGGGLGSGSSPRGAHIAWVMENLGSNPCGRGYPYAFLGTGANVNIECLRYLGPGNN